MTNADKPRQKPDFKLEKLDDDLLLFHPALNKVFYCNETAALIWELCNGERTVEEIGALITAAYPDAADEITAQIGDALNQFSEQGAIEYA